MRRVLRAQLPQQMKLRLLAAGCVAIRSPALTALALVLALSTAAAHAADANLESRSSQSLSEQRALFTRTMDEVQRGNWSNVDSARAQLAHYALVPYLEHAVLQRDFERLQAPAVAEFLRRYSDAPLARDLRNAWLRDAARRRDWTGLLTLYDETTADDGLRCAAIEARMRTGDPRALEGQLPALWVRGLALPTACATVVQAWLDAGGVTDALAEQRIDAALRAGNLALARSMLRLLSAPAQPSATDLVAVYESPTRVLELAPADTPRGRRVLVVGVSRLAQRDARAADGRWQTLRGQYRFEPEERRQIAVALIAGAWTQGYPRPLEPVPETADGSHVAALDRIVTDTVAAGRWPQLAVLLAAVPTYTTADVRWRYWHARALELAGGSSIAAVGNATSSVRLPRYRELFAAIARDRSYYGFMAADRVRQRPALTPRLGAPDTQQLANAQRLPGITRTFELLALGRTRQAQAEWRYLLERQNPSQRVAAGYVAARAGLYRLALQTVIDARIWDALELRFPTAYADVLFPAAADQGIDPSWVFAVARQESAFDVRARSPAGALGLMQLMPATGALTARKVGIALPGDHALLEPEINVRLGSHYLAQMYTSFGYHRALASAGYNAGPGRVRQWLQARPASPVDVWIETIPFRETRQYVQNVLLYAHIYSRLLGTQQPFLYDHER